MFTISFASIFCNFYICFFLYFCQLSSDILTDRISFNNSDCVFVIPFRQYLYGTIALAKKSTTRQTLSYTYCIHRHFYLLALGMTFNCCLESPCSKILYTSLFLCGCTIRSYIYSYKI